MKLTLDMIKLDVDYVSLYNYESNLSHELKSLGTTDFIKNYKNINTNGVSKNSNEYINLCYLLGLLEYLDESLSFDKSIKLEKYVVDLRDFDIDLDGDDLSKVENRFDIAIPQMLRRGFIYSDIDIAI